MMYFKLLLNGKRPNADNAHQTVNPMINQGTAKENNIKMAAFAPQSNQSCSWIVWTYVLPYG